MPQATLKFGQKPRVAEEVGRFHCAKCRTSFRSYQALQAHRMTSVEHKRLASLEVPPPSIMDTLQRAKKPRVPEILIFLSALWPAGPEKWLFCTNLSKKYCGFFPSEFSVYGRHIRSHFGSSLIEVGSGFRVQAHNFGATLGRPGAPKFLCPKFLSMKRGV